MPRRTAAEPYAYLFPLLALEALFVAVPLCIGVYYSLHQADYFELKGFRGLDNYIAVLESPLVRESLVATAVFAIGSLVLTFALGFSLALYLERDTRLNALVRAVVLVPYVIAMLVGSLLLKWIFSRDAGVLDIVLLPLGLADVSVLADPKAAMAALMYNAVWRDSAFAMVLLMAGLKGVDARLYAAARVDGAGPFYRFYRLTLPLLRIPIFITIVRLLIHFVNVLTFALVLTGGGPGGATQTMGLTLYRIGFIDFKLGNASALAVLVLLFNLALIAVLLRLFRERRVA